eukprot:1371857-Amorphochlora_amoeboformis.AAC.1
MRAHGDLVAPTAKFSSSQRFSDGQDTGGGTVMRSHEDLNAKSTIKFGECEPRGSLNSHRDMFADT